MPTRPNNRRRIPGLATAIAGTLCLITVAYPAHAATRRAGREKGRDTTTSTPSAPTTAPVPAPTSATTVAPLRGPVRIMVTYRETVNDSTRAVLAAAQARAAAQNTAGGVKGRRIEIIACNNRFELAGSEACARLAVSQKVDAFIHGTGGGVAAPAGSNLPFANDSSVILPILAEAGIPWQGVFLTLGGEEATSPVAFPFGSIPVAFAGLAVQMVNEGCSRIAFLGGQFSREPFRRGLASKGREVVFEANFPRADPASAIPALLARNVDCVFFGSIESEMRTFIEAVERTGRPIRFAWLESLIGEKGLTYLGPTIDGAMVASNIRSILDLADPAVRRYRAELDQFNSGVSYDALGFGVWGGLDMLLQAMRGIDGDINAASTLSALRSLKANTQVFGTVDFTKELADPQVRRMFTTNAFTYRVVNAKLVRSNELDLRPLFDRPA